MISHKTGLSFAVGIVALGWSHVLATQVPGPRQSIVDGSTCRAADSTEVGRVASRFHKILSTGDTTGIRALLAPDLRVIEGGTVENLQEYLSHHLSADIEFAKSVKEERTSFSYKCEGNIAWLVSTSTSIGNFSGRDINSVGAELMLLSRMGDDWRIRAIHWSSQRARK